MDHNLDDSLNLESAMGSMDFDHSGEVVNQEDIALETTSHDGDIPMEFEHIEEQPMLMDTGSEEIVSDFMGDQFALQEFTTQDDVVETVDANQLNILTSHSESMIDLQFDTESMSQSVPHEVSAQPKYIQVKAAAAPPRTIKKDSVATNLPRQVAIAPKPPAIATTVFYRPFVPDKQYAIAPKPILVANKGLGKKMSLTGVIQSGSKTGNAVLTQIGKQLVMVPTSGGQKLKLVTSGSGLSTGQYAQLMSSKQGSGATVQKPLVGKIIVQGQSNEQTNSTAVITKLMPTTVTTAPQTKFVMQPKAIPINIGGTKVLMASPTKQGVELKRGTTTTKKVVITANQSQNVILKTTAPPKTAQVSKEGTVLMHGQRSQLHQINVPGKGIQYIRLITNSTPAPQKQATKAQTPVSFVLADGKDNIIMATQKVLYDEPPPLLVTRSLADAPKMTPKPQKKLVRIAPVAAKPAPSVMLSSRSSQSLLAPLSPLEASTEHMEQTAEIVEETDLQENMEGDAYGPQSDAETKSTLRALLDGGEGDGDGDRGEEGHHHINFTAMNEVEVEFERPQSPVEEESNSMMEDLDTNNRSADTPLIVIPSDYGKQNQIRNESKDYPNIQVNVEGETLTLPYLSPKQSQHVSDADMVSSDLGLRPRKACNCTKSQCLKLYCDCFANGEFCNRCNCNNCHNNLENEELRQTAIRACLDRNPNAFRPKIGKAKSGGPDIIRRHNKGCNCKRSGCLKNYCECYEAKIACTSMCKCVGCRNVEETLERRRDSMRLREKLSDPMFRPPPAAQIKQPCSFMTSEVIEAVCQCLIAAAVESTDREGKDDPDGEDGSLRRQDTDPMRDVVEEFARCLQDIIGASHQSTALSVLDEGQS